jgi:mitogen-activated protein kinase 15
MSEEIEPHVLEKYEIMQKLGRGAYGIVWKARNKKTNQMVALKKVYDAFQNSTDAQRTYREVMYLEHLNGHENIIQLLSLHRSYNNKDLYLVFDLMETDLHIVIRAKILKPIHKQFIMYQLFKSLKYIHSADLIHRDLKPSNMLINSDCLMKLADFGLARSVAATEEGPPIVSDYIATRWYRAPEILLGSQSYSKAVDIWSAGCIMAELLLEQVLFSGKSSLNQMELIIELLGRPSETDIKSMKVSQNNNLLSTIRTGKTKSFTQIFGQISPEAVDLLRRLLVYNPEKRLSVKAVLEHPYFEQFHNEEEEILCQRKVEIPIDDNERMPLKVYRDAIYDSIPDKVKEQGKAIFDKKRSIGMHSSISGQKSGSPEIRQNSKTKNLFSESVKEEKSQPKKIAQTTQKILNKENFTTKKFSKEVTSGIYDHKSQSLLSKKKKSEDTLNYNIYKARTPDTLYEKSGKSNILGEKVDSNQLLKPKINKSLNDSKNFVIGGLAKKKSDGLITSNLFMQKYQSLMKSNTSSGSTAKLNPHFLFKSRAK